MRSRRDIKNGVDQFLTRVRENLLFRCNVNSGETLLVGVSGGVDSVVLLDVLCKLREALKIRLVVAHFNHQLRGRAADVDEDFVRGLAIERGLPYCVGRGDVYGYAEASGVSIEMAAREFRHGFLAQVAQLYGAQKIALGHQLDDQVELFFLRVLRGAGGEGLRGMEWVSRAPVPSTLDSATKKGRIWLVRPLLSFRREEIERYAQAEKLRFRLDVTNYSEEYLRNRIRHRVIPLLKRLFGEAFYENVSRVMDIVAAESRFVTKVAQEELKRGLFKRFDSFPLAVQRQLLRLQLIEAGVEYDFEKIERLRISEGIWITFPRGINVMRDGHGRITVVPSQIRSQPIPGTAITVELNAQTGVVDLPGLSIRWTFIRPKDVPSRFSPGECEYFDADAVGRRLVIRHWKPGDRFMPIGFPSTAKLQDLFVNWKIPLERRRQLWVAESESGEIFWVEGLRIGEKFKITSKTRRVLKWEINRSVADHCSPDIMVVKSNCNVW
jgi:tRNA(Ile)-lysidine synthase